MTPSAIDVYALALEGGEQALHVRRQDGSVALLALDCWLGPLTAADEVVLDRARAPVLDVGCGPGRHVLALAHRGRLALGVDIAPAAVRVARRRGAQAIEASVFDRIPGAGTWGSALLLDGNIGIGGAPDCCGACASSCARTARCSSSSSRQACPRRESACGWRPERSAAAGWDSIVPMEMHA